MKIILSRFHLIYRNVTDRQTDGRTDRIATSISRVSVLTRDKKPSIILANLYCTLLQ